MQGAHAGLEVRQEGRLDLLAGGHVGNAAAGGHGRRGAPRQWGAGVARDGTGGLWGRANSQGGMVGGGVCSWSTRQEQSGQNRAGGSPGRVWLATHTSSCSGALSSCAHPVSLPSVCPYPTQARLAVADAPPVETGALTVELLCRLQERKLRAPRAPTCPPTRPLHLTQGGGWGQGCAHRTHGNWPLVSSLDASTFCK